MLFLKFIIYTPRYDELAGGSIVLHKLCDKLNKMGHTALVWPMGKPRFDWKSTHRFVFDAALHFCTRLYRPKFGTRVGYQTPVARPQDVDDAIVIYPEIVSGNPLNAERYVRWFLHRPGFHFRKFRYRRGDLFFYYQEAFNKGAAGMICGGRLVLVEYFRDIYKMVNDGPRTKVCHMVRKGSKRDDLPDLSQAWVIDGLSHAETAAAFNECKVCYFYDSHTLYTTYAVLCGCIPVIVPEGGQPKELWVPEVELRYGIAYGIGECDYALATRDLLLARLNDVEAQNDRSIAHFVNTVRRFFVMA